MSSPYYPPRARWYGRLWYPWYSIQRGLRLDRIHLPPGLSPLAFLASLAVPGVSFWLAGRRVLAQLTLAIYFVSAAAFIALLGMAGADLAYGLMIGAHASSIIYLQVRWLHRGCRFQLRLALAFVTFLLLWVMVYVPLVSSVENHWCLPVRLHGQTVVVQRWISPEHVRRGDHIVVRQRAAQTGDAHAGGGMVMVSGGLAWGEVLAQAGDRVAFGANGFSVNGGRWQSARPHMPTTGEIVVPEKHWFLWPELDMNLHGNVSEGAIATMMLEMAVVDQDHLFGKPFRRWFWRRQTLS